MFSALFSFLGGSVFRMIWGEVSAWFTARQEHAYELDRLKLQGELDAATHERNLESLRVQSELDIKVVEVQRDADVSRIETDAWRSLVESTTKQTGIKFLDIWNGAIRPLLATLAISVVVAEIAKNGFALSEWDRELVAAILGIYVADRSLLKRGK
jgi:hypothetical protein